MLRGTFFLVQVMTLNFMSHSITYPIYDMSYGAWNILMWELEKYLCQKSYHTLHDRIFAQKPNILDSQFPLKLRLSHSSHRYTVKKINMHTLCYWFSLIFLFVTFSRPQDGKRIQTDQILNHYQLYSTFIGCIKHYLLNYYSKHALTCIYLLLDCHFL